MINPSLRTLALCCRDAAGVVTDVRDLYQMNDLVVLPEYVAKQIIWDCFQRTSIPVFMLLLLSSYLIS